MFQKKNKYTWHLEQPTTDYMQMVKVMGFKRHYN